MGLKDRLTAIFVGQGAQLYWRRIDDDHVAEGFTSVPIDSDQAYFVIRMKEMFLARIRELWRKYYPMLYAFTEYGAQDDHAVAGPGQLRELGDAGLDRIVNVNYRLTGPTPFRGGDIALVVGLYAVPGKDVAKQLITTVSDIAALGGLVSGQAAAIASTIKQGIDGILGLDDTKLQLGISDAFYQANPLRTGYYLGIAAPESKIDDSKIWLRQGRLVKGDDPNNAKPYEDRAHMVLEIERREQRDDWPGLPGLAEFESRFAAIMADGASTVKERRARLNAVWPTFQSALAESPYLIQPDRERIALSVVEDLKRRLDAVERGGPFEARSWTSGRTELQPADAFDFLDVGNYLDPADPNSVRRAKRALEGIDVLTVDL